MTNRERLMATLKGESVDRPPVNFYELGGFASDPADRDPYNVFSDLSWLPLIDLTETQTDLTRMVSPGTRSRCEIVEHRTVEEGDSKFVKTTLTYQGRSLTSTTRQDKDVFTVWAIEPLLKNVDDLRFFLSIPDEIFSWDPNYEMLEYWDKEVGDRGVVMVDTPDPLCVAAQLFDMEEYLVIALTEQDLFKKLLMRIAIPLHMLTERVAQNFPGHLWRIYGPEYAAEPYLPTRLFEEYVGGYTGTMVLSIQKHGGFARMHCHGRMRNNLPIMRAMGVSAIDPIEPPPYGDVSLSEVREKYGKDFTLFGNIEITDIENLPSGDFEVIARRTLQEGMQGEGKGFVFMPTAAPYGRKLSRQTLENYRTMVRLVKELE